MSSVLKFAQHPQQRTVHIGNNIRAQERLLAKRVLLMLISNYPILHFHHLLSTQLLIISIFIVTILRYLINSGQLLCYTSPPALIDPIHDFS